MAMTPWAECELDVKNPNLNYDPDQLRRDSCDISLSPSAEKLAIYLE